YCFPKVCRTALKFAPFFRPSISYKEHLRLSHFKTETSRSLPMTGPIRNPQKPRHAGRHDDDRARGNPGGNVRYRSAAGDGRSARRKGRRLIEPAHPEPPHPSMAGG